MCICLCLHLYITIIYLSISLEGSECFSLCVVSFNFSFDSSFLLEPLHFPNLFPISWIIFSTISSLSTWRKVGRVIYSLFYIWQAVWPQPIHKPLVFQFLPCKRGQEFPFCLLPWASMKRIQRDGNSSTNGCHCWDLLFTRHLISTTSLSPKYSIWRVWIITFRHFPEGTLRPHMFIWPTQHYRTESLFKPMSLPWDMYKILMIKWPIKMIGKYTVPLQWQLFLNTDS